MEKVNYLNETKGLISDDKRIYHTIRKPEHFFRIFKGFGISVQILDSLKEKGIKEIHIRYLGKRGETNYYVSLENFILKSEKYSNVENGKIDSQRVLSIMKFDKAIQQNGKRNN